MATCRRELKGGGRNSNGASGTFATLGFWRRLERQLLMAERLYVDVHTTETKTASCAQLRPATEPAGVATDEASGHAHGS